MFYFDASFGSIIINAFEPGGNTRIEFDIFSAFSQIFLCDFNAFFSGKGEEGRGLGLYISKKVLERNDYTIRLAEFSDEKKLSGANFVVPFVKQLQDEY